MTNEISPLDLLLASSGVTEGVSADAVEFAASMARDAAERSRFDAGRGRPVCYPADGAKCSRCRGRGVLDAFRHVSNGTCFRCEGWGVERSRGA